MLLDRNAAANSRASVSPAPTPAKDVIANAAAPGFWASMVLSKDPAWPDNETLAPFSGGILVAPKRSKASLTASRTPLSSSVRASRKAAIES